MKNGRKSCNKGKKWKFFWIKKDISYDRRERLLKYKKIKKIRL